MYSNASTSRVCSGCPEILNFAPHKKCKPLNE